MLCYMTFVLFRENISFQCYRQAPFAAFNVYVEKIFKKKGQAGQGWAGLISFLFWTTLYQLLFVFSFFWTDIIPGFGHTDNIQQFLKKFVATKVLDWVAMTWKSSTYFWWRHYSGIYKDSSFNIKSLLMKAPDWSIYKLKFQHQITPDEDTRLQHQITPDEDTRL